MKRLSFFAIPLLLALSACAAPGIDNEQLASRMENPLYAERYYDDLVEQMVGFVLQEDTLLQDEAKKELIERTRVDGLRKAAAANDRQREGLIGSVVSDFGYARGEMLLLDGMLYVGPEFETIPGPDLRVHLSTVVDPRDGTYPDDTAVDLGTIANTYGAHAYVLPEGAPENLRTVVLYDHALGRIYGFAQLSSRR